MIWIFVFLQKEYQSFVANQKQKTQKILLIAQNKVAADHINLVWRVFKEDPNLTFYVTDDNPFNRHFSKNQLADIIQVDKIHILKALLCYWNLIIYVNHPWGFGTYFAPFIKKVYINHGICTGKINNNLGQDGVYGRSRVIRPYSRPFYDKMFAASLFEKAHAISSCNELKNRIAVTGFLRADLIEVLEREHREEIRKSLGYSENDIVVHIISTWGSTSLFQTIGEELLNEVVKNLDSYKFVFSLHPRHDEFGDIKGRKRKDILKNYEKQGIRAASELSWDEYVVASDLAVSDHSSLCLYHLLLNKPIILVPVNEKSFVKKSIFDQLKKLTYSLENTDNLNQLLKLALINHERKEMMKLAKMIRSHPGKAAENYKNEIYNLLNK